LKRLGARGGLGGAVPADEDIGVVREIHLDRVHGGRVARLVGRRFRRGDLCDNFETGFAKPAAPAGLRGGSHGEDARVGTQLLANQPRGLVG
jgi:hypothetical protein